MVLKSLFKGVLNYYENLEKSFFAKSMLERLVENDVYKDDSGIEHPILIPPSIKKEYFKEYYNLVGNKIINFSPYETGFENIRNLDEVVFYEERVIGSIFRRVNLTIKRNSIELNINNFAGIKTEAIKPNNEIYTFYREGDYINPWEKLSGRFEEAFYTGIQRIKDDLRKKNNY